MSSLIDILKEQFGKEERIEVIEELESGLKECIPHIFKEAKTMEDLQEVNAFALRYLVLSDLERRVR